MRGRDCEMVQYTMDNSVVPESECCNGDPYRTINKYNHIEKSNHTTEVEIAKAIQTMEVPVAALIF